jgi:hypothetical protein
MTNTDFSCYVTIINKTSQPLNRISDSVVHGNYVSEPPLEIPPHTSTSFQLKKDINAILDFGSKGDCRYGYTIGGTEVWYHFAYSCPHLRNANSASVEVSDPNLPVHAIPNPLPTGGHPVRIQFILE